MNLLVSARWVCLPLATVAIAVVIAATSQANPSSKSPDKPLDIHATIPEAEALSQSIAEVINEAAGELASLSKTNGKNLSARKLATVHSKLWLAEREVRRLEAMGEPAGISMRIHLAYLHDDIRHWIGLAGRNNRREVEKHRLAAMRKLKGTQKKMLKFNEQMRQATSDGKFKAVDDRIRKIGPDTAYQTTFLRAKEYNPLVGSFYEDIKNNDSRLLEQLSAGYRSTTLAKADEQIGLVQSFYDKAKMIADKATQASSGDQLLDAFDEIATQWALASAATTRGATLQMVFASNDDVRSIKQANRERTDQTVTVACENLALVIAAAKRVTTANELPRLHQAFLTRVVTLQQQMQSRQKHLKIATEGPLMELVSVDPTLSHSIEQYTAAANEPLRWREKFAAQTKRNLANEYPKLAEVMAREVKEPKFQTGFIKRPNRLNDVARVALQVPAPLQIRHTTAEMLGAKLTLPSTVRLSTTIELSLLPMDLGQYAYSKLLDKTAALGDLKQALMVDETFAPLTFRSTDAVTALADQSFEYTTGEVTNIVLEGNVTRLITLQDKGHLLCPLGQAPPIADKAKPINYLYRFDIKPTGGGTRYAVVKPSQ